MSGRPVSERLIYLLGWKPPPPSGADRLDGTHRPVGDAAWDTRGTGNVLASLEGANLLGIPLDRRAEWYQYHCLFRELVGAGARPQGSELARQLHVRAAAWCEANGLEELAIDHAQAAGDADRAARLVECLAFPAYAGGRINTARGWFQWFEDHGLLQDYPPVAVLGAYLQALAGQPEDTERWAVAAEQVSAGGMGSHPSTMEGLLTLLAALLCRDGIDRMLLDAQAAVARLRPGNPWRVTALVLEGIAYLLAGQPDRADAVLAHTVEVATHTGALPAAAAALAERSLVAMERHDWTHAETLAERALAIVRAGQLHDYVVSPLVYAVAARVALHQDDLPRARDHLARADRLRSLLTHAMPHRAVQTLVELGRAYLALGNHSAATATLRQAGDILQIRPDLGVLPKQAEELRARLDLLREHTTGAPSLTRAELRLLPLLATHLTFREIGERLYVTQNTVKAQAVSAYRKLGVASRGQAVRRIQQIGLLDAAPRSTLPSDALNPAALVGAPVFVGPEVL